MIESIHLDYLQLHGEDSPYFIVQPIEGLEFPNIRTSQFNRSGMDGIYVSNQFLGERRITLTGYARGVNHEMDRKALEAVCVPQKTNSILNKRMLHFKINGREYCIGVQILGLKFALNNVDFGRFMIDLIAVDNSIFNVIVKKFTINPSQPGGYVYPVVYPISFSAGSGGRVLIQNEGNTHAFPIIRLNGGLTNPRIENQTTGEHIALTINLPAGQYIDIDTENRTIIQGGITNVIYTKSADSRFFSFPVGTNELFLSTSLIGEGGSVEISFRDSFVGI